VLQNLTDRALHVCEVTNASRTLLMNIKTLSWDPVLMRFFGFKDAILPRIVSSSEVYGDVAHGALKGVPIGGLVGDQQGALVGNKCLEQGLAKCTYGTGAFLLFCTGADPVKSDHGLLTTVAYQAGPKAAPVYALEGSSELLILVPARVCADARAQSASRAARSSGCGTR
jgi:glycerol kinase